MSDIEKIQEAYSNIRTFDNEEITKNELIKLLSGMPVIDLDEEISDIEQAEKSALIKGATPLTVTLLSPQKMLKKHRVTKEPNPFAEGSIFKLTKINGLGGVNYEAAVNRQREREGLDPDFKAKQHKWADESDSIFVKKNGKFYLRITFAKTIGTPIYVNHELEEVDYEELKNYLPSSSSKNTHQGTEKKITFKNPAIDNIIHCKIRKRSFDIVG